MIELDILLAHLRTLAPEESALPDDPVGLLVEPAGTEIARIGVCLDATLGRVGDAIDAGATLIVAHHPLIYRPLARITPTTNWVAAVVARLLGAGAGLYAMHTNWDAADGGVNDTLSGGLGLVDVRRLGPTGMEALPRMGRLPGPMPYAAFRERVVRALGCAGQSSLRWTEIADDNRAIHTVAVCGGAGAELAMATRAAGADAYVTSDVRHHEFVEFTERGFPVVDAGHYATEAPGMKSLAERLRTDFPALGVDWLG